MVWLAVVYDQAPNLRLPPVFRSRYVWNGLRRGTVVDLVLGESLSAKHRFVMMFFFDWYSGAAVYMYSSAWGAISIIIFIIIYFFVDRLALVNKSFVWMVSVCTDAGPDYTSGAVARRTLGFTNVVLIIWLVIRNSPTPQSALYRLVSAHLWCCHKHSRSSSCIGFYSVWISLD